MTRCVPQLISLGLLAAAGLAFVAARTSAEAPAQPSRGVRFAQPLVELGKRKATGTIPVLFAFEVGPGGAELVELRTSCGCLKSRFVPGPRVAGTRGVIALDIHASGQPEGRKRFQARLTVRDPVEREMLLEAEAVFESHVKLEPANVIVNLPDPTAARAAIELRGRYPRPLRIVSVASSRADFAVRTVSADADSNLRRFEVAIPAGLPVGTHDAVVRIVAETTHNPADAEKLELEVPVRVVRPASRSFLPAELVVRRRDLDGGLLRLVRLLDRTGGEPMTDVKSGHPAVAVEPRGRDGVMVKLQPGAADTQVTAKFPDGTELVLPVRVRD